MNMQVEKMFAVKAVQHMDIYGNIPKKIPGSELRLKLVDAEILAYFCVEFPGFGPFGFRLTRTK
jgi:hypothetical protein